YYNEIFADPVALDRVYSMDTYLRVTDDGGKTWRRLGQQSRHVDDHVIWVDPRDTDHYLVGGDGGLYESFDRAATWRFFDNLPITQFYRVAVDEAWPTYYVYGGTQDNNTLGGPNRTLRLQGPANGEWFVTQGGDGFYSQIDPTNPDIVYSEAQHGALTRYDRKSGENVDIQPQPAAGEAPYRWNWDSPLVLSPHSPTRLYFAANKLFRSDDRGDSWRVVSSDLTRQLDRDRLQVFGRVQKADAVARHASTSYYGNIVALDESAKVEGLLYAGTDDGLVQVSENGGADWRAVERFPGVPDRSYVSRLVASRHDADVVYAAFDNHKMGEFEPYLLKSADRGRTWKSIASDLPERGTVYALVEDPVAPGLLFAGTEFGLYLTLDGGGAWVELTGGLRTINVRDLAIQRREGDLVVATFGRGFYILDDLTPLRALSKAALEQATLSFPVAPAWLHVPTSLIGGRGKGFLGETYYTGANPPLGATLT
ncbi:MAG: glycosyl hydrolase, partial [Thermoanaerobaculia bacterium]|nr:glycosyl hydrolase [Thermoanaerobaculia bacterium]